MGDEDCEEIHVEIFQENGSELSTDEDDLNEENNNNQNVTKDPDLNEDELEEWRTIFNLFDVDGDQSITKEELGVVLRSMGQNPSEFELKEMIREMDEDGSGTVDFQEFVILMQRKVTQESQDQDNDDIEEAFKVFDRNKDGVISADELSAVMVSLGNPRSIQEIQMMIAEEDDDNDGVITKEEFVRMLTRKPRRQTNGQSTLS